MIELKAQARDLAQSTEKLRAEGLLPAVYYGKKTPSTPISVETVEFLKVLKKAGESSVVTLSIGGENIDVLIHDVAFDPVTDMPIHVDFYVFNKNVTIEVAVPLEFTGIAPAVKDLGGLLVKVIHELKIEALPTNLPHQIEVDITGLTAIGDQILAGDIKLPQGVALAEGAEEVVVLVSGPKAEEVESAPVDLSAIEVEKKGKEKNAEEGGESEAEAAE